MLGNIKNRDKVMEKIKSHSKLLTTASNRGRDKLLIPAVELQKTKGTYNWV